MLEFYFTLSVHDGNEVPLLSVFIGKIQSSVLVFGHQALSIEIPQEVPINNFPVWKLRSGTSPGGRQFRAATIFGKGFCALHKSED